MLKADFVNLPMAKCNEKCGYCFNKLEVRNEYVNCLVEINVKEDSVLGEIVIDLTTFHNNCFVNKLNTFKRFNIVLEELTINNFMRIRKGVEEYNDRLLYNDIIQAIKKQAAIYYSNRKCK